MSRFRGASAMPVVMAAGMVLLGGIQVCAEELKWRQPMHNIKAERVEVGDVPNHFLGTGANAGLAFFEGGDVASVLVPFTYDYTNGNGPHQFYTSFTFADGSTLVTKGHGTTTVDPGGKTASFQGTFSFTSGSGRFAGIQGEGRYTGRRIAPMPGVGAELYSDNTATYKLSSR